MNRSGRRSRVMVLARGGLVLVALAYVYLGAPPPTRLAVRVVDGETGNPLAGASVWLQAEGRPPLPWVMTDETGEVHFELVPPHPAYGIRVQHVGYEAALAGPIAVAEGSYGQITVALTAARGGRLYVGLNRAEIVEIDVASGLAARTLPLPGAPQAWVRQIRAHPSEDLLYVLAGDKGLILDSGAVVGQLAVETGIESLDLSADGRYVLATTVRGGLDASGMLGLAHLLVLDARSGQVVTDTLLAQVQSSAALAADYPIGATRTSPDHPPPARVNSLPGLLWQPDGTDVYVLEAAEEPMRRLEPSAHSMLAGSTVPTGPRRFHGTAVLSHDRQVACTWRMGFQAETGKGIDPD